MLVVHKETVHEVFKLLQLRSFITVMPWIMVRLLVICPLHLPVVIVVVNGVSKPRPPRLVRAVPRFTRLPSVGFLVHLMELVVKNLPSLTRVLG